MVAVYQDEYLRKLWTVYEVACALLVNPDIEMSIVPVFLPKLILGANCVFLTIEVSSDSALCSILLWPTAISTSLST